MLLECTLALLSFTFCLHWTEYTHKLEKKEDMKLKHTTKSSNWPYLTSYQIGPIINQFLYLHYSILSILCACSLYLSLDTISFLSITVLHKHDKGSCSAIFALQASRDQGFNFFLNRRKKLVLKKKKDYEELMEEGSNRGEMSPASEISLPEADTHTSVVFVKFTR